MSAVRPDTLARIGRWIDRGLAFEYSGQPRGLAWAHRRYTRAAAILRHLLPTQQAARVPLARASMNLANLAAQTEAAVSGYDEAIALLADEAGEAHANMRGAAWLNRGTRLLRAQPPQVSEARRCFDQAIAVLGPLSLESPHVRRNLAAAWMNRAAARALDGAAEAIAADATIGLNLITPLEAGDAASAEIGLKSRLLWLTQPAPAPEQRTPWIAAASDGIDHGLALGRRWLWLGQLSLDPLVQALFRVGAGFYLRHLPQFLAEYLREHLLTDLPADFPSHHLGNECATAARQALHERQLRAPNTAAAPRLRELGDLLDRLAERQASAFAGTAEGVWLSARLHELAGRAESARLEWLRHLQEQPHDTRALAAARAWPGHRGDDRAAQAFAAGSS